MSGTGLTPRHICTGTGHTPRHICTGTGLTPRHICTGTGRTLPLPHEPCCTFTGRGLAAAATAFICGRRELPLIEALAEVHRHLGPMDKVLWGQAIWNTPDEPTIAATMDAADKLLKPGGLGIWKGTAAFNTRGQSASERVGCGPFHHLCAGTGPHLRVLGLEAAKPRAKE